jgi:hypothetical protein
VLLAARIEIYPDGRVVEHMVETEMTEEQKRDICRFLKMMMTEEMPKAKGRGVENLESGRRNDGGSQVS